MGVTVVLQDVTRLMRFDELKNDLVATVAHEFRTPLTSLRMAIHLCAEEAVGPSPRSKPTSSAPPATSANDFKASWMTCSTSPASRPDGWSSRPSASPPRPLASAAELQRPSAEAAGLSLSVEDAAENLELNANRERVGLVLSNLLVNAIRHTPRGGAIALRAVEDAEAIRFEVTDTGEGIPEEHQVRIFEKFYRVPGARAGGVGLGLYIAREIVQAHGGDMGVRSVPGRGSTFWFRFRARPPSRRSPPLAKGSSQRRVPCLAQGMLRF